MNMFHSVKPLSTKEVRIQPGGRETINIWISGDGANLDIAVSNDMAGKMAAAVLEAAGITPRRNGHKHGTPEHLEYIAQGLRDYNEARFRASEEAREREELEAEAFELLKAYRGTTEPTNTGEWKDYGPVTQKAWVSVALKARKARAADQ